jgi:hypothetical protein
MQVVSDAEEAAQSGVAVKTKGDIDERRRPGKP